MIAAKLEAELAGLSREMRAGVLRELVKREVDKSLVRLRAAERAAMGAIDSLHAEQDLADRWFALFLEAAGTVGPARDLDDADRSEALRRRVA